MRPAGWVFGHFDGFVGKRIYPSWSGALEGKRIVLRDVRLLENGTFVLHNAWKNLITETFPTIADVERHIIEHGVVQTPGANVWD